MTTSTSSTYNDFFSLFIYQQNFFDMEKNKITNFRENCQINKRKKGKKENIENTNDSKFISHNFYRLHKALAAAAGVGTKFPIANFSINHIKILGNKTTKYVTHNALFTTLAEMFPLHLRLFH